jgi:hypothetical protein
MSDTPYNSEKKEEVPISTELMVGQAITQEMTPVEKMIPLEASIGSTDDVEKHSKLETETAHEKRYHRKTTQRKRTSAQLSQLLKQARRNEIEIYQMRKSIESLARLDTISTRSNLQSMKQIRLQLVQLRGQVVRIQKDFRRIRTSSAPKAQIRKIKHSSGKVNHTLRPKKGASPTHSKSRRRTKTK